MRTFSSPALSKASNRGSKNVRSPPGRSNLAESFANHSRNRSFPASAALALRSSSASGDSAAEALVPVRMSLTEGKLSCTFPMLTPSSGKTAQSSASAAMVENMNKTIEYLCIPAKILIINQNST